MKVDLHSHSTYSDGTLEPEDLITAAHRTGITHLALSDHDSTAGLESARAKAQEYGMTIIPAIEINTLETNTAIHILGYFIDEKNETLQKSLDHHREIRVKRAQLIVDKLKHMGIRISMSDFGDRKDRAAIGRPHIADKLKEKGIVFSRQEAFDKYLSRGRSAYVAYQGPTPQQAIEMILACKGVPVVAHPGYSVQGTVLEGLVKMGLQGIEVFYPSHNHDQVRNFIDTAKRMDLIATGGSDYHGPGSGHEALGEMDVPDAVIDELLARKQKLFG
jgi:predicted metal-dependent phosphoesterase TrpH